jgi:WD40 repeat protein
VLSVSDDGVVARWYPEFDHVERFTRGHTGRVFAVAVSGDGQTAFSAAADNTALEWDLSGQRRFGELVARMPRGAMWWAISNDGNKVALAYEDGSVSLTDLATGTEWQSNSGIGLPFVIAFSPDGNRVAVAGQQGSIAQLDTSTGRAIGEPIDGFGRPIFFIVYSPDGQTLAVADEGSTWLVDGASGSTRTKIIDGEAGSYLAWSNDGSRLAVGLGSGDLLVWDVVGNSEVARVDLEEDNVGVTSVAWSGDGNQIATGSASGATRLWSTGTWEPIGRELRAHGNYVIDMRFSSDGKWLATFGGDGAAAIWDVEMGRQLGVPLVGSQNEWGGVWLSPNGERLKTYQGDGTVWEWPLNDNGWLERVCAVAGRDLTHDEWATYAPGLEASPVCQDRQGQ